MALAAGAEVLTTVLTHRPRHGCGAPSAERYPVAKRAGARSGVGALLLAEEDVRAGRIAKPYRSTRFVDDARTARRHCTPLRKRRKTGRR